MPSLDLCERKHCTELEGMYAGPRSALPATRQKLRRLWTSIFRSSCGMRAWAVPSPTTATASSAWTASCAPSTRCAGPASSLSVSLKEGCIQVRQRPREHVCCACSALWCACIRCHKALLLLPCQLSLILHRAGCMAGNASFLSRVIPAMQKRLAELEAAELIQKKAARADGEIAIDAKPLSSTVH